MDRPLLALTRRRWRAAGGEPGVAANTENMRQLVQLRWIAVAGQLATILVAAFALGVALPLVPMLALVALAALVNLASTPLLRRHRVRQVELLLALLFDVGSLAMQLYLSGGATNPFVSLFLLQVVLGAILLERWASWVIVAVTSLSFAVLALVHRPLMLPAQMRVLPADLFTLGAWLCFGLVATLLVLFVTRVIRNLRLRDARLADMRQQAAEEDHLVRMGLFASGAAHELGTPLASLAVILGDWRRMPQLAADPELVGEIAEMQAEVQRCKAIVTDVLHSVAELPAAAAVATDARALIGEIVDAWRPLHPGTPIAVYDRLPEGLVIAADPALRQAILNLLDNAAEASPEAVDLAASAQDDQLALAVRDRGPGFDPATLDEIGKPQQSRKGPGHGVGLFLAASVVRRLGGTLAASNRADGGAEVQILLPLGGLRIGGVQGGD